MNGRPVIVEHETGIKNVAVRPGSLELVTPGKSGASKSTSMHVMSPPPSSGSGTPLHSGTLPTP